MRNKEKVFEETFVSQSTHKTKADALIQLNKIRDSHPEKDGWVEILGYIDEFSPGEFTAVRYHAQYR